MDEERYVVLEDAESSQDASNEAQKNALHISGEMGETEDQPSKEFLDLFDKLDKAINGELIEKAWKQYDQISQQIVLEGNKNVWMACAFYSIVLQNTKPGQELVYKFSLIRLLNLCDTSILEFFDRLDKWAIIVSAPRRLQERINRVQANLATTFVVLKKFLPIFRRVYANSNPTAIFPSPSKIRKTESSHPALCTTTLFEFIWTAFIAMKKELVGSNENLINSFHLILCIIAQVFSELQAMNLEKFLNKELLNSNSPTNNLLELFCHQFGGVILDAKHFQTYWFLPRLEDLVKREILQKNGGASEQQNLYFLSELKTNMHSLRQYYEAKNLSTGEIDERIFIGSALSNMQMIFSGELDATIINVLHQSNESRTKINAQCMLQMTTQNCLSKVSAKDLGFLGQVQQPEQKTYMVTSDQCFFSSPAKNSKNKNHQELEKLIKTFVPGNSLENFLKNSKELVDQRVKNLGDRFVNKVSQENFSSTKTVWKQAEVESRRSEVQNLFYRLLHKVLEFERARNKKNIALLNLNSLLENTEFVASIYICSLELVLFCHDLNTEREFPWSLELIGITPLSCFKIIESVIRADEEMPREMIKHLNKVEERILEELAWQTNSPLWGLLFRSGNSAIPKADTLLCKSSSSFGVDSGGASDGKTPTQSSSIHPSLALFFRKVYHLAAIRISDLCDKLHSKNFILLHQLFCPVEEMGQRRVWTLFENVLRNETSLMLGRHIDQVSILYPRFPDTKSHSTILCTIIDISLRRLAESIDTCLWNLLLISTDDNASRDSQNSQVSVSGGRYRSRSALPVPEMASNPSAPPTPDLCTTQDFSDLIKYYNRVFVSRVEDFVRLMTPPALPASETVSKENLASAASVSLIPLPREFVTPLSPRRLLNNRINIVSLSSVQAHMHGPRVLRFDINRSPSKNLKDINAIINCTNEPPQQQ